jgi:WXXGXW repeat (2 copies)
MEKESMKKALFTILMGVQFMAAQVSVGIQIGPPPPPRVYRVHPLAPGPDYIWLDGYWYADGRRWRWHDGYWTRAPYAGARWIAPRYESSRFFNGYWEGDRGRFEHDHRWDRDRRERDHRWERDHDRH